MIELMKQGGPMMVPLLCLSVLAVAVVIERALFWVNQWRSRDRALVNRILKFVEEGDLDQASQFGPKTKDFVARTLLNGLRHRFYSLSLALETQSLIELKKMKKNLVTLDTIITAAPLLGILGTVLGIILSFNLMGFQGVQDPKLVTGGIAQALITTAFGLSIALVTLFPFNYFQSRYTEAIEELENTCSTLEILVDKLKGNKSSSQSSEEKLNENLS